MNILKSTARVVTGAGEAATAAVGAVGGAAVGSFGGSIRGAVEGAYDGAQYGRRSTPVALATLGAVGAAGLVEWPIVLAAGGTALVLRQFRPEPPDRTVKSKPETVSSPSGPKVVSPPNGPTAAAVSSPSPRTKRAASGKTSGATPSTVPAQPHP
ncbi:hypothetical protein P3H15_42195 [Rhodococcus sp. T2V]|uniref:hypothetical protein n=1 Tax=Rhodococcus sp. T2V TaxID=3034164 RepID=UPI0023E11381|nr:hypothetical protein [Rhodococcus sp. T2V]MDF3311593.1 hypothetical protein [Rhodococcus sp. T2V]